MAQSINNSIAQIATATHCQAGATVAYSGAFAVALAQATANGCLAEGGDQIASDAAEAMREMQRVMTSVRERYLALAVEDAEAIGKFVQLRESGQVLEGYGVLCDGPQEMAELALQAAQQMQAYRPFVCERTHDDLEFALTLITSIARAATQLLDSNLRIWPLPELHAKYDPAIKQLYAQIGLLQPVKKIR